MRCIFQWRGEIEAPRAAPLLSLPENFKPDLTTPSNTLPLKGHDPGRDTIWVSCPVLFF
jgi:hypothetical protein